jgi:steroid delta-isomerase-like uncharacterized protein
LPKADNLDSVRAFFERVLNAGDLAYLDVLSRRDVLVPQSSPGLEGLRRHLTGLRDTFADPEYRVVDTVSEGEKVVIRFSAKATHAGRFMGIPATGRVLKLWGVMIFRFDAGAIAEFWSLFDALGVLEQLRSPG